MPVSVFKRAKGGITVAGDIQVDRACQYAKLAEDSRGVLESASGKSVQLYASYLDALIEEGQDEESKEKFCERFLQKKTSCRGAETAADALERDVKTIQARVKAALRIPVVTDALGEHKTYVPMTAAIQKASECGTEFTLSDLMPRIVLKNGPKDGVAIGSSKFRAALAKEDKTLLDELSYEDRQALLAVRAKGIIDSSPELKKVMFVNSGPLAQALGVLFGLSVKESYDARLISYLFADVRGSEDKCPGKIPKTIASALSGASGASGGSGVFGFGVPDDDDEGPDEKYGGRRRYGGRFYRY